MTGIASTFLNLSTDNTLGGNSPSDSKAVSEKAIKEYIDNNPPTVSIDNETITENSEDELQTVAVKDSKDSTINTKFVQCTKNQYDTWVANQTIDANTHYTVTDDIVSANLKSFRNVGDIFFTSRLDTYLNGAVECDGSEYNLSDYIGEQAIGTLLANNKLPYVDFTTYASIVASKGSCRAFAYDSDHTTFKVPTLSSVFIEAGTAGSASEFIDAGLPNIEGSYTSGMSLEGGSGTGCITISTNSLRRKTWASEYNSTNSGFTFDASASNSIYGNSTTVQPNAVKYRAMVQLATQTTDEAIATMTTLNSLPHIISTGVSNSIYYRIYSDGYCEQWGVLTGTAKIYDITLPKTYSDANYFISAIADNNQGVAGSYTMIDQNTQTQNFFTVVINFSNTAPTNKKLRWKASGFLAEGEY